MPASSWSLKKHLTCALLPVKVQLPVCLLDSMVAHPPLGPAAWTWVWPPLPSPVSLLPPHYCPTGLSSVGPGPQRDSGLLCPAPHFASMGVFCLILFSSGFPLRDESGERLKHQEVPLASPSWVWPNQARFPLAAREDGGSSWGSVSLGGGLPPLGFGSEVSGTPSSARLHRPFKAAS